MRTRPTAFLFMVLACGASAADWLTDGGDIRRTNHQTDETVLTKANVNGLQLLWKTKLDNTPRQMHSLLEPLVIGRLNTKNGPREVVIEAGSSDNVYALDAKTGELLWKHHFDSTFHEEPGARASVLCPGGMTANVTIGPGKTAGEYIIYAAGWDGRLHMINASTGDELGPPTKFMPPNGKPYALNLVNNVIYTHTAQGCGGNPNMAYSYDLATHKVGSWGPAGGGMWGRSGPAVASRWSCIRARATAVGIPRTASSATASSGSSRTQRRRPWTWWTTTAQPTQSGSRNGISTCRCHPRSSTTRGRST